MKRSVRAGIGALAAASLVALVIEDTGTLMISNLAAFAWVLRLLARDFDSSMGAPRPP